MADQELGHGKQRILETCGNVAMAKGVVGVRTGGNDATDLIFAKDGQIRLHERVEKPPLPRQSPALPGAALFIAQDGEVQCESMEQPCRRAGTLLAARMVGVIALYPPQHFGSPGTFGENCDRHARCSCPSRALAWRLPHGVPVAEGILQ